MMRQLLIIILFLNFSFYGIAQNIDCKEDVYFSNHAQLIALDDINMVIKHMNWNCRSQREDLSSPNMYLDKIDCYGGRYIRSSKVSWKGYYMLRENNCIHYAGLKSLPGIRSHFQTGTLFANKYYRKGSTDSSGPFIHTQFENCKDSDLFFLALTAEDTPIREDLSVDFRDDSTIKLDYTLDIRILTRSKFTAKLDGENIPIISKRVYDAIKHLNGDEFKKKISSNVKNYKSVAVWWINPGKDFVDENFQENIVGQVLYFKVVSIE